MADLLSLAVHAGGLRVMLVEDESLIAMLLEDMLEELGHIVVGPYGDLTKAIDAATIEAIDIAILDVNINGGDTFPIAVALASRDIAFIFATGYNRSSLPLQYREGPVLQKPFRLQDLRTVIAAALAVTESVPSG
jgi:CheY-like chemotaxis protein